MPPVIPTEQQQIEAIQEAERVQTPSASSISEAVIDAELLLGPIVEGGKLRVYALYQQEISTKDAIAALKDEYGMSEHDLTFLDGSEVHAVYQPTNGLTLRRNKPKAEITVAWSTLERRIRQLIADGKYLSQVEREKYESDHLGTPQEQEQYNTSQPEQAPAPDQPPPPQPAPAAPGDIQAAIDAALQEWNGDISSKRAVVSYMEAHARERDTAAWLRQEYGDDLPAFPVPAAYTDLSWPKVQRRIAQLIQKDQFYKQEELDNFMDIDTAAVREHLESGEVNPIVEQIREDVERLAAQEAQTGTPPRDPLAPAYREGDTVYLNDTAFIIQRITTYDVQLLDPTLAYPVLRSESKENFERLLWKDKRNNSITEFWPADLDNYNSELREVLTTYLLTAQDKDAVSGWLRSGEGNRQIAQRLLELHANRAGTVLLKTGEVADYRTSKGAFTVDLQDRVSSGWFWSWNDVARVVRALYQQELDGFSHEPVQREAAQTPEQPAPAAPGDPQAAIDAALREWNGNAASKQAVVSYMEAHAREKGTAAWLRQEYGNDLPAFPVPATQTELPWPKVQRRIAQLIQKDQFYTQEDREQLAQADTNEKIPRYEVIMTSDAFPDPEDAFAIWDNETNSYCYDDNDNRIISFPIEEEAAAYLAAMERKNVLGRSPSVRELYEYYKPHVKSLVLADEAYQNACKNSDRENALLEGNAAVKRSIHAITDLQFTRLYYDMAGFHTKLHQEILDETYPILSSQQQEQTVERVPVPEMAAPARDPMAPAYREGDTVYLDDTAFVIKYVSASEIQLLDPTLAYPVLRAENRENFERLLRRDMRNGPITEFLPADLDSFNADIREVLTEQLLLRRDKDYISGWLQSGKGNREIAQLLSELYANRSDTVTMETGEIADYFTSTVSLEVDILDNNDEKKAVLHASWDEIAPALRALWQQAHDGFSHEPVHRETVWLEGKPTYQVGDRVVLPLHDREIRGTISHIGEDNILIDTGPYAWSQQTINRGSFEDALRLDERNAHLFTPEVPEQQAPEVGAAPVTGTADGPVPQITVDSTTFYSGEKNNLPFDVIVERIKIPEQEQEQNQDQPQSQQEPQYTPAAENFHITDDNLGVGTMKEKFHRNMDAINTLRIIEMEGRSATPVEQEILSRYVGWGGLPDAFDPDNPKWADEFLELQAALTPEEYSSARSSTLNAHYTSPVVIKAIYEAVKNMGFRTGNILEPSCGVGNFFGLLPESMAASKLYGVELDSITGRIAQQLYPKANIQVRGFEKTEFQDGFFDLAIGNVPFGDYKVVDRRYDRQNFLIHDYFFAKTIDKVRAGGVIAFITSSGISGGTMDKKDSRAREYLAQRCDLLGAIRLPNNAFKANAGTETVMDIVFLQKRKVPLTPSDPMPDWVQTNVIHEGTFFDRQQGRERPNYVTMNPYFQQHPEMVLGELQITTGPYGPQQDCLPIKGAVLADQLHEAISHIHGEYKAVELPELDIDVAADERNTIPANPGVKNYSYAVVDGEVYYRENSVMVKAELNDTAKERVMGMVELRDCVRRLIDLQLENSDPLSIQTEQKNLNRLYDAFTEKFGIINSRGNALAFDRDSAYYLLCSLENLDEDGNLVSKADMFNKRTIQPHRAVSHVDTAAEALAVSIGERARVDLPYMSQLTGRPQAELVTELRGVIFRVPGEGPDDKPVYQTADEYLSGNVREKLSIARNWRTVNPEFAVNVEALEQAQPKDLDASEIDVSLGADWVDRKYYQQFMQETFKTPGYLRGQIKIHHSEYTSEWRIEGKHSVGGNDVTATLAFGTERANAYDILEDCLNLRDVRVYDAIIDPDGKERRVINKKETTLAQQKQQTIKNAFRDWIWQDPDRRAALVRKYNDTFNAFRPREYDGRHIVFAGMNPEIALREHQVNAIAHVLYGGNTLLAHEVGAGKTFEMIAAAMESKRLGLCRKSLFVVPNHLIEQWASEFLRLYPSANILVSTKKEFESRNRKKFCARIATGDYDAIIMGHSQFERLPISRERRERMLRDQIEEITEGIRELKDDDAPRFTIKQLERTKKGLTARLEKLLSSPKDDVVTFEQLGIDRIFYDEAQNVKNLFLYTKMRNVAGLSTTDAQKSSNMLLICRYMDEITGGKGVILATGTPISNSMVELYTMMRYLQFDTLKRNGHEHFDSWAADFGNTLTSLELKPEGTGFRSNTRFAQFYNLPELMNIWKEAADIQTADMLKLPAPEAEYITVTTEPSVFQKDMVFDLGERADAVRRGEVKPEEDNMLRITSDGRKLALDQRIMNPLLPDDPNSKVNACVNNVFQEWQNSMEILGTQLVFCDLSTPGKPEAFNVYDDIKEKLTAKGVPESEIAFIHDANTETQKAELFAKVRRGQVRVLLGSTQKMGAGTNVQDRIVASHDLDCPWRPADLEQRAGRSLRQGNMNQKVKMFKYVTTGTFDAYNWALVENKQKFIGQVMTSKSPARSAEDVDATALSYAEIKALATGDDRIREKMELDVQVAKLKMLKASHESQRYKMQDKVLKYYPQKIAETKLMIEAMGKDLPIVEAHPVKDDAFSITIMGKQYTERKAAGQAIINTCPLMTDPDKPMDLGEYRGFPMRLSLRGQRFVVSMKQNLTYTAELSDDPV